jgi:hypothetical protein
MNDHGGGGGGDFGGGGHHGGGFDSGYPGGGFDSGHHGGHHGGHSDFPGGGFAAGPEQDRLRTDLPDSMGYDEFGRYRGRASRYRRRWPAPVGSPLWWVRLAWTLVFFSVFGWVAYQIINGILTQGSTP